jgi:hypothetical protein
MDDYDYGYESSRSSDGEEATKRMRFNSSEVIIVIVASILIATTIPIEPPRIGNCRGERLQALQYVRSWDDDIFRRQFRLCRLDFGYLLSLIAPLIQRDEGKARKSSGSSISPEMRLVTTLRILAVAKYLDMIWYRVDVDHVNEYVLDYLHAITDEKGSVLRTMQEIAEQSKPLFENVINALKFVFPGCTQRRLKVIKSLANDTPQLTHTDFDVSLINKRVFSLDSYHYSVVIALQADTHLLTGTERKRIDIPINSMIMFRGDFPHAGGGYAVDNTRIFISVSSPFFTESDSVFFVN